MATRPATERPRYELVSATFSGGQVADFGGSPWQVEFIPVNRQFAAVRAFHRREAWQEPFTLREIARDWPKARRLQEIRYAISLGGKREYFVHKFKPGDGVILTNDAIRGAKLFITVAASVVMGHKRFGSRAIVQFSD